MAINFWENIPDDCKKAINELKRLKAHRLAGYDNEETFADVWWCILHEVDLYADGEFRAEDYIAEGYPEEAKFSLNLKQAQIADRWLCRWVHLFNKYKTEDYCGDKDFSYHGQSIVGGAVMATQAQRDATARYDAKNTVVKTLKLNKNTDSDILEKLDSVDNIQGYLKELIRRDIMK